MTTNVGLFDRAFRVIAGLALLGYALYGPADSMLTTAAWIGVVPLVTGLVGYCPLYSILGFNRSEPV